MWLLGGVWHVFVEFLEKLPPAFLSSCCFPKPPHRRARPSARVATARGTSLLALQASVPHSRWGEDSPLSARTCGQHWLLLAMWAWLQ